MESKVFWMLEPFLRDGSCNIVFTAQNLALFLSKHCSCPWDAGLDLSSYSTRVDKDAFDSGSVVIKQPPPITCFNLTSLPNELITSIFSHLSNKNSPPDPYSIKALSLTSRRIRDLATPFYLNRMVFNQRFSEVYGWEDITSTIDDFKNDPVPLNIFKYVQSVKFENHQQELTFGYLKGVYDHLFHVFQKRQELGLTLRGFSLHVCNSGLMDQVQELKADGRLLTDFVSKLPGLRTLELRGKDGFDNIARLFLSHAFPGLHSLVLQFDRFSSLLDRFSMTSLRHLMIPTLPSPGISLISHSNLETLILNPTDAFLTEDSRIWDLKQLHDLLLICADTLKILHIQTQLVSFETEDDCESAQTSIPAISFKRLTILRLWEIYPQSSWGTLRPMADFFSLAPIRRLYAGGEDFGYDILPFMRRLVKHRLEGQSAGWKQLELISMFGYCREAKALEKVGVTVIENGSADWVQHIF